MAATVIPNLTLITNNDNDSNWNNTDWNDTEVFIQGSWSESWYVAKNTTPTATYTPTSSLDMSATDTHLYIWLNSSVASFIWTKANWWVVFGI